ncbi:pinensin family lanthipeptide [Luteibaculum oceani]|uniref:TIGR04139 family peptide modification target n=1 Tax=Luteibaculum oceani TaxID=1294296 RepID=A0A5C6VNP2_9FLAO|nr:pinensin family lanthipeptide [Luteibaculum oceani]TXC85235.1 hypothetical protein FRX97_01020 [Luteibaculum oceani]
MKKKLKLNQFKVKSFVTELNDNSFVKGGGKLDDLFTKQSCYHYMSCNQWECLATRYGNGEQIINCNG